MDLYQYTYSEKNLLSNIKKLCMKEKLLHHWSKWKCWHCIPYSKKTKGTLLLENDIGIFTHIFRKKRIGKEISKMMGISFSGVSFYTKMHWFRVVVGCFIPDTRKNSGFSKLAILIWVMTKQKAFSWWNERQQIFLSFNDTPVSSTIIMYLFALL